MSTARRVFNRPCLVICVEPRMTGNDSYEGFSGSERQRVWFSGLYEMVGFRHTINSSTATSEFSIIRGADKGSTLTAGGIQGAELYNLNKEELTRGA